MKQNLLLSVISLISSSLEWDLCTHGNVGHWMTKHYQCIWNFAICHFFVSLQRFCMSSASYEYKNSRTLVVHSMYPFECWLSAEKSINHSQYVAYQKVQHSNDTIFVLLFEHTNVVTSFMKIPIYPKSIFHKFAQALNFPYVANGGMKIWC